MQTLDTCESTIKAFKFETAAKRYDILCQGSTEDAVVVIDDPADIAGATFVGVSLYEVPATRIGESFPVMLAGGIAIMRAAAAFDAGAALVLADELGRVGALEVGDLVVSEVLTVANNTAALGNVASALLSCNVTTASGATGPVRQETLAVANDVATLSEPAAYLLAAKAAAGGTTGAKLIEPADQTPAATRASFVTSANQIKFAAADAVTSAIVQYVAKASARTGPFGILPANTSPGVGQVSLTQARDHVQFAAADNVTACKVVYLRQNDAQRVIAFALAEATAANDEVPVLITRQIVPTLI